MKTWVVPVLLIFFALIGGFTVWAVEGMPMTSLHQTSQPQTIVQTTSYRTSPPPNNPPQIMTPVIPPPQPAPSSTLAPCIGPNSSGSMAILSPTTGAFTIGQTIHYTVQIPPGQGYSAFNLGVSKQNCGWPGGLHTAFPLVGSNGYSPSPSNGTYSGTTTILVGLPPGNYYLYALWSGRDSGGDMYTYSAMPFQFR
jgi:hypothetical protein